MPQDLSAECEGTLKVECAALIFYCVRIKEFFTLEELNHQLDKHPFQESKKPPYFTEGITKGRTNPDDDPEAEQFLPNKGCHVHQTSGDMMTFALHSPAIFKALGVPENDPVYVLWMTHVEYFSLLIEHTISYEDMMVIDRLICSHHAQMQNITVYEGIWKPKNHFADHFALNIKKFGPPRYYWFMRFEAMNQVFKKIAVGGSYRDTTKRCANFWTVRSARIRKLGSNDGWGQTTAKKVSTEMTYARNGHCVPAVAYLFTYMYPTSHSISLSWVGTLYHEGTIVTAGYSWVEVTLISEKYGSPMLAHVGEDNGIFLLNGQVSLFLSFYPILKRNAGCELVTEVPFGYEPVSAVVVLAECASLRWLWPVNRKEETGGPTSWFFVRY